MRLNTIQELLEPWLRCETIILSAGFMGLLVDHRGSSESNHL